MLAAGREGGLDFEGSSVVCIRGRNRRKRLEAVGELSVVVGTSGRVAELERDRVAQRNLAARSKWRKRRGHGGFGQPRENAGVDQVSNAWHLFVGTPRLFGGFEVETALLAEQGNELKPSSGMDDLVQSGVDRRPQGGRAEDLGRLLKDILVNLYRRLRHRLMISRLRNGHGEVPRMRIPERRAAPRPDRRLRGDLSRRKPPERYARQVPKVDEMD